VLTIILDHAARATNAANGSVLLLAEGEQLKPVASLYTPSSGSEPAAQPPIEPALEAVRTAAAVTASVSQRDGSTPASVVYIPLHTPAGTLGVLALVSQQGRVFARRHLDFLTSLCSEAALAIENAQLRSELRRLAVTDPLTGMPNRREVERHLSIELERAARSHRPLSLMMLDVDNLKEINDGFGHAVGDEILIALAQTMQQSIRSSEIAGRIGGDEFTIVLPETESRQAIALAERVIEGLPQALRSWPDLPDADLIAEAVGVSVGIAGNEDGLTSPDKLAARADAALYEAKRTGKNRVCATIQQTALW
jgi:diguanylate cyclase (GGDEF)-like protein